MQLPQLKKTQILLVLIPLVVMLGNTFFFSVLGGAKDNLQFVQGQLQQEKTLLAVIQQRLLEEQDTIHANTIELQKRLPSQPIVDQLLVNLENAEKASRGQILSLSFNEASLEDMNLPEVEEAEVEAEAEAVEQVEVVQIQLPEGMNRLLVNVNFRASNYESLVNFLSQIETLDRISKIDQISFSKNQESADSENNTNPNELDVNITLSTFYVEGLDGLIEDLPKINYPPPSNKKNPLNVGR
jgi:type IV pilus assembly protein PilO